MQMHPVVATSLLLDRCVSVGFMWMLFLAMACSTPDPVAVQEVEQAPPELVEVAPVVEEVAAPAVGSIGGEPILPSPVVLGAISASAVETGVGEKMEAINRCYKDALAENKALSGKVLVRFTILRSGSVSQADIKSTSLRHEAVEACVIARLAEARFPSLEHGKVAIVTYPFVFGLL